MIGRLIQDAFTVQGQLQFTNGSVVLNIHAQVVVVEGQQQGGWLCHVVQPFGDKDKGIVFVPGGCQCLGLDGRSCRGRMKRNGSIGVHDQTWVGRGGGGGGVLFVLVRPRAFHDHVRIGIGNVVRGRP